MIKLRHTLERGRAHPVLGPILLILLVLMLAMMCLHAAHDSQHIGGQVGAICLGIATIFGALVLERHRRRAPTPPIEVRGDRGQPEGSGLGFARPILATAVLLSVPLRR